MHFKKSTRFNALIYQKMMSPNEKKKMREKSFSIDKS